MSKTPYFLSYVGNTWREIPTEFGDQEEYKSAIPLPAINLSDVRKFTNKYRLTKRQHYILYYRSKNRTQEEIARKLKVTQQNVAIVLKQIRSKVAKYSGVKTQI